MVEEGKPGFFAIASAPGADATSVELLIKSQPGSTAEAITQLSTGGELLVSSAQGKGFPLDRIPASDFDTVLMVRKEDRESFSRGSEGGILPWTEVSAVPLL